MKRCLLTLLTLALLLFLTACAAPPAQVEETPAPVVEAPLVVEPPAPNEPFPGKIAMITYAVDGGGEEYYSARHVVAKYGEDKIIHRVWPANFMQEQQRMIEIVAEIAADPEVKALVINQATFGTNAAVAKMRETRDDIFVVYCGSYYWLPEDHAEMTQLADLVLEEDNVAMGAAMVEQAYKMGAKTFVHYSFPRHMEEPIFPAQRDRIKETCDELGIKFVAASALDPAEVGISAAQQYILDDVPKMVAKYGRDTAFFCTYCSLQMSFIKAITETGAIYPQPCCPSPYHGFPAALGIGGSEKEEDEQKYFISETARRLKEKGILGRVSTWPVSAIFLHTNAAAEYAIKWLNGEVPKDGIDVEALKQCMEDYAGVECYLRPYVDEEGVEYGNYLLVREDYLTYGEEHIVER